MSGLYDRLVNKILTGRRLFRVKRRGDAEERDDFLDRFTLPFITVSREPGSGGRPIAKQVSKWLGYKFYDKKIVEDLSRSVHRREALLKKVDERGRSAIDDIVHGMFNPDYISDTRYIKHLSSVVLSAAVRGEVVILGRGGNFITPRLKGLHVRVSAPYLVRVGRAVKYEKISPRKAKDVIKEIDYKRKKFISQYFNKNISNGNYYDLLINTEDMSIQDAAEHVALALKNKFPDYAKKRKKLFHKLLMTF